MRTMLLRLGLLAIGLFVCAGSHAVEVTVNAEETVYSFTPPNNGSGPLWSYGNTQIVRLGDDVYVSEQDTGEGVPLLCNTRWNLVRRTAEGWKSVALPEGYRQREPCPVGTLSNKCIVLNVNDSQCPPGEKYGKCEPALIRFDLGRTLKRTRLTPDWGTTPYYTDHSYRGYAVDRKHKRLLMLNIDAKTSVEHACLMDAKGRTLATGAATFPIRACYPQVSLNGNAVHVLAIGDIVEPVKEWREYKFEQTKQKWDYVFRILYYTQTPDLTRQNFNAPLEIANVDATAGAISNCDLWVSPSGEAHILYTEREVQTALLRDKFFPGKSIIGSLWLAVVKDGQVVSKRRLFEGKAGDEPGGARFHVLPNGHVYVVLYRSGNSGQNALMRAYPFDETLALTPIPLKQPLSGFCTASVRAGNKPSRILDLHGQEASTMLYAQVEIKE